MYLSRILRVGLLAAVALSTLSANALITEVSFSSNGGSFVNDTIANGTSPIGFTNTGGTANAFLNNADSTLTGLAYGSYYAIAFLGFGQHLGAGTFSVRENGVLFSTSLTFPSVLTCCTQFASLSLAGGDSVTLATTGLSADRIRVFGDGAGLNPDGTADVFYQFTFTQGGGAVPEPGSAVLLAIGVSALGFVRFRRR